MEIATYLDRLRNNLERMDPEEREAVLVEVRDYLDQESERLRNLAPGLEKGRAVAKAIEEFGAPEDIAIAYDGQREEMAVVNQRTGEWLLDLPTAGGSIQGRRFSTSARALRVIIKYRGATVLGILGLAAVFLAAAVFFADQAPEVQGDEVEPIYSFDGQWDGADGSWSEAFEVPDEGSYLLRLDIRSVSGCAQVEIDGPSGTTEHVACGGETVAVDLPLDASGWWAVHYTNSDYAGSVDVDVYPAS